MATRNYPSIRAIAAGLNITGGEARVIREVIDGTLDPCDVSPAADAYRRQCHNPPDRYLLKLYAINELIKGSGVEYLQPAEGSRSPGVEYVNLGDPYVTTVLRIAGGRYRIACWGDLAERGGIYQ
jgi:hypothetical protein